MSSTDLKPLCVDLDGTFTRTDTLHEMLVRLVKQRPWMLLILPFIVLRGKSAFKHYVAERTALRPDLLPLSEEFNDWLKGEKQKVRFMKKKLICNLQYALWRLALPY